MRAGRQALQMGDTRVSIDENRRVVRRWTELWNAIGVEGVDEIFAEDSDDPQLAHRTGRPVTLDSFKEWLRALVQAMGDPKFEEHETVAEGDRVLVRWTVRGIHSGTIWGVPPTGRPIAIEGVNLFRLRGGRIVERRSHLDPAGVVGLLK